MRSPAFAAAVVSVLLASCASAPVVVNYRPSGGELPLPAEAGAITVNRFIDDRGEPPRWLGAIRGGFGNPLKTLEIDETVAAMVQTAFAEGIRARGGAAPSGARRFEIRGVVKRLDCNQVVRRVRSRSRWSRSPRAANASGEATRAISSTGR